MIERAGHRFQGSRPGFTDGLDHRHKTSNELVETFEGVGAGEGNRTLDT